MTALRETVAVRPRRRLPNWADGGSGESVIVARRAATEEEWDHLWSGSPCATYFQSRDWAETWRAYTGGRMRPAGRIIRFADGVDVLLPLTRQRLLGGLRARTLSSPAGTSGGWVSAQPVTPSRGHALAREILGARRRVAWRVNPFDPGQRDLSGTPADPDVTHAIPTHDGLDALRRRWSRGNGATLRKARQAVRAGVQVRHAASLDDWLAYFQLYEASLTRWGTRATSRYPWTLFDLIRRRGSGREALWLATWSGRVVAGALCLHGPRIVSYWHGAAAEEAFPPRAVNLLMCTIAEDACRTGHAWFDLGPSGPHEGVAAFKRSLRAEPLPCPLYRAFDRS